MELVMSFMDQVNYNAVKHENLEVLTSFDWEIEITQKPNAVFWPDDTEWKSRLKSIQFSYDLGNQPISVELRGGYKVRQPGQTKVPSDVAVTIEMQDFEDQLLAAWLLDWVLKCQSITTRRSLHKKDLICPQINVYRLNSSRTPVKQWTMYNCLPNGNATLNDTTFTPDQKNALQATKISLIAEFTDFKLLNITNA